MAQQNPFCEAEYDAFNDMKVCARCMMTWDANDPFPLDCQFEANNDEGAPLPE